MKINLVCGDDDFLVESEARQRIDRVLETYKDQKPNLEIVGGQILLKSDLQTLDRRLSESLLTLPLFSSEKVVWLKSVNFLKSAPAESAEQLIDHILGTLNRATALDLPVFVSASPIDRRLKIFKRLAEISVVSDLAGNAASLADRVFDIESEKLGLTFSASARNEFILKVGNDTRLIASELEKLSLFLGSSRQVESYDIREIVCAGSQENFFEPVDFFYAPALEDFRKSIDVYFRTHTDGRPLLAALLNRNRLLIQLKAADLLNSLKIGPSGMIGRTKIADLYNRLPCKVREKPITKPASLMAQNFWYLSQIATAAKRRPLEILLKISRALHRTAEDFVSSRDHGRLILDNLLPFLIAVN